MSAETTPTTASTPITAPKRVEVDPFAYRCRLVQAAALLVLAAGVALISSHLAGVVGFDETLLWTGVGLAAAAALTIGFLESAIRGAAAPAPRRAKVTVPKEGVAPQSKERSGRASEPSEPASKHERVEKKRRESPKPQDRAGAAPKRPSEAHRQASAAPTDPLRTLREMESDAEPERLKDSMVAVLDASGLTLVQFAAQREAEWALFLKHPKSLCRAASFHQIFDALLASKSDPEIQAFLKKTDALGAMVKRWLDACPQDHPEIRRLATILTDTLSDTDHRSILAGFARHPLSTLALTPRFFSDPLPIAEQNPLLFLKTIPSGQKDPFVTRVLAAYFRDFNYESFRKRLEEREGEQLASMLMAHAPALLEWYQTRPGNIVENLAALFDFLPEARRKSFLLSLKPHEALMRADAVADFLLTQVAVNWVRLARPDKNAIVQLFGPQSYLWIVPETNFDEMIWQSRREKDRATAKVFASHPEAPLELASGSYFPALVLYDMSPAAFESFFPRLKEGQQQSVLCQVQEDSFPHSKRLGELYLQRSGGLVNYLLAKGTSFHMERLPRFSAQTLDQALQAAIKEAAPERLIQVLEATALYFASVSQVTAGAAAALFRTAKGIFLEVVKLQNYWESILKLSPQAATFFLATLGIDEGDFFYEVSNSFKIDKENATHMIWTIARSHSWLNLIRAQTLAGIAKRYIAALPPKERAPLKQAVLDLGETNPRRQFSRFEQEKLDALF